MKKQPTNKEMGFQKYQIAHRDSWENYPIDRPKRIEIDLRFTKALHQCLKKGVLPHKMEEKWFVFFEDEWLYFHRSWTGIGIYKAEVIPMEEGFCIKEFWVERNEERYSCVDDEMDRDTLTFLIAECLLGIDSKVLLIDKHLKSEKDVMSLWSTFGNALFGVGHFDQAEQVIGVFFGLAVGDALGVPVEFESREVLRKNPVVDMRGFGTYKKPPGTFSDDSSMSFCLAEALTLDFDLERIAKNFVAWRDKGYWTADGTVFDIGNTTNKAIDKILEGCDPAHSGEKGSDSNGNGSLMRIAPLLFMFRNQEPELIYTITEKVSAMTHGHLRSIIACVYYLEFAKLLAEGKNKFMAYHEMQLELPTFLGRINIDERQITYFDRLFKGDIFNLPEAEIDSTGYVVHTLEASMWCILNTDCYRDAVLRAVNLGEDTDTTAAVTGALAGLIYGVYGIPDEWIQKLARKEDIEELAIRLARKMDEGWGSLW